jgi:putative transcriptional regulator
LAYSSDVAFAGVADFSGMAPAALGDGQGAAEMRIRDYENLLASIREAGEIKAGRRRLGSAWVVNPVEIKKVRARLQVSQREFALLIGVSARTLQNWEQGRRQPEGPAKALLRVTVRNPEAVLAALHQN